MLMSLAGIVFGVGFFILTQAQTSGFEKFYIDTIIGTDSPIRIKDRFRGSSAPMPAPDSDERFFVETQSQRQESGIEYPQRLREAVMAFDGVTAVSEVVRGEAGAVSMSGQESVMLNGIRLQDHLAVTNLSSALTSGSLEDFQTDPARVMLGIKLADRLDVRVGEYITIETPGGSRSYRVAAIFESGVDLIDRRRIFCHLSEARALLRLPFSGALFQIAVEDPDQAEAMAAHMQKTLRHRVVSWQERERTWLEVFTALRASSAITVSTIIFISGLGMFNTLAMLVLEKTREIAILRSMGYTRRDITNVFLWQGAIILFAGTLLGWLFGALGTYTISKLPIRVRGIFSTDSFVVNWDFNHYLWAAVISAFVVMGASLLPARKAAKMEPGTIIRGAGQ